MSEIMPHVNSVKSKQDNKEWGIFIVFVLDSVWERILNSKTEQTVATCSPECSAVMRH